MSYLKSYDYRVQNQFGGNASLDTDADKVDRYVLQRLLKIPKDSAPLTFTSKEVQHVFKNVKGSMGPDISMLMLKHIGSREVKYHS